MENSKSRSIVVHILGSTVFVLLPILFAPGHRNFSDFFSDSHTLRDLLAHLMMLVLFYANYFFFIPRFYFQKKYIPFALFALSFLLLITFFPPLLFPFERRGPMGPPPQDRGGFGFLFFEMGHQFFLFAATMLMSLTLKINGRWRRTEQEKLNAELSYLKAQINPHFLFNTLNSIYSLSIVKSDKTPEAVVKLSGMMRYVLSESHNECVSLDKEIDYITNYIDLQRIRLDDTVKLTYEVTGNAHGKYIAPLVLIPFVENAFKHGVNTEEVSEIQIRMHTGEDYFWLEVLNNKVNSNLRMEEKSGLGIDNTKNRLNLLYPDKYDLVIRDDQSFFSVMLKISF